MIRRTRTVRLGMAGMRQTERTCIRTRIRTIRRALRLTPRPRHLLARARGRAVIRRRAATPSRHPCDDRTAMGRDEMSGRRPRVTVLGFDGQPPSAQARRVLAEATLVIGNIRHLDALPIPESARRIYAGGLGSALTHLALNDGPAVVVASGDPGFFGVVRALRDQDIRVRTLPAVSSVATAFGRVGMAWEDALVVAVDAAGDGVDPTESRASGRSVFDTALGRPGSTLRTAA